MKTLGSEAAGSVTAPYWASVCFSNFLRSSPAAAGLASSASNDALA